MDIECKRCIRCLRKLTEIEFKKESCRRYGYCSRVIPDYIPEEQEYDWLMLKLKKYL